MRSRSNLPTLAIAARAAPASYEGAPSIPQNYTNPGISLRQVYSILWAYRKQAAIIASIIIVISAVYAKSLPKTYTATATLMINNDNSEPLAGGQGQVAPIGPSMSTEIQLMQSAEVLLPVIDQLKLSEDKNFTRGYSGDGSTLPDYIRENLAKNIEIDPGIGGSQLITVAASARSPMLAAQLANVISDVYMEQQKARVSGPASERAKRYAQELSELKDKVRVAQDQVTAFRQRNGVTVAAAPNNNLEAELLTGLENRLAEAQMLRRAAEVKSGADQNLSTGAAGSDTIRGLQNAINTDNSQLAQLQSTLGARHPKVLELQNQLAANRQILAAELRKYADSSSSDLAAARQLEAKLVAAVADQRSKVLGISRLQDEGTKYVLELESAQSVYKRALDGYDQIMFASGGHFANINIVSRAVPPQKASKPNKVKLVLMGAIAGIFLGLAGPMAFELLYRRRIRCSDDFERDFAIPVLMEFYIIPAAGSAA